MASSQNILVIYKSLEVVLNTFEEILKFSSVNKKNFEQLVNIYKDNNKSIVPFVGAGLSAFAYSTWGQLLEDLNKEIGFENQDKIHKLIEDSKYEEAADKLCENKENLFHQVLKDFYGHKELVKYNLSNETINILPVLFPESLIITTNFDKVIEKTYANYHIECCPAFFYNNELLSRIKQLNNQSVVFKVHGDINSNNENVIFTGSEYDIFYQDTSPLVINLQEIMKSKVLLFIGASLNKDRTLDILKKIAQPGINHYAILPCKEDVVKEKIVELYEKYRIKPILYPETDHKCVSILLERLLQTAKPKEYAMFPKLTGIKEQHNRFDYRSINTDFFGRNFELQQLSDFMEDRNSTTKQATVKWWAVTGQGGSGKSRLVEEFTKPLFDNWSVKKFERSEIVSVDSLDLCFNASLKNILFVIDYVQSNTGDVAKWIELKNRTQQSKKAKMLLLQRESVVDNVEFSDNTSEQDLQNIQKPQWLKNMLEESYTFAENQFRNDYVELKPLTKEDLIAIMSSYAKNSKPEFEINPYLDELYNVLMRLDPVLHRPLFAMFIIDAKLDGKNPDEWDKNKILDNYCNREEQIIRDNIKNIFSSSGDVRLASNNIFRLYTIATITGDFKLPSKSEDYLDLKKRLGEDKDQDCLEILSMNNIISYDGSQYLIPPIEPDLMGEYFANRQLEIAYNTKGDTQHQIFHSIIKKAMLEPVEALEFFHRLFMDYSINDKIINELSKHIDLTLEIIIYLQNKGDDTKALELIEKALMNEDYSNKNMYADIRYYYTNLLEKKGDYKKALKIILEAIDFAAQNNWKINQTLMLREAYGNVLMDLGRFKDAVPIIEEVYKDRLLFKVDEIQLTYSLNNLGKVYDRIGNYPKSLLYCLKSYEIRRKILGETNLFTVSALHNLANAYSKNNQYSEALEHCLNEYSIRKKILGYKHIDTIKSACNLALRYRDIGDFDTALEVNKEAYELLNEVLGQKDPLTLNCLYNLSLCYTDVKNFKDAFETAIKAYTLSKEVLGEEHPQTLSSMHQLSKCYRNIKEYGKAVKLAKKNYKLYKKIFGKNDPITLNNLQNLSYCYRDNEQHGRALISGKKVCKMQKKTLGLKNGETLSSMHYLAQCYSNVKNFNKALEYSEIAYRLRSEVLGEKNSDTLASLANCFIIKQYAQNGEHQLFTNPNKR